MHLFQINYLKLNENGNVLLKRDHVYYYQVIGQMRITNRPFCYFVVHTQNWTHIEKIDYDLQFWKDKMESKLKR